MGANPGGNRPSLWEKISSAGAQLREKGGQAGTQFREKLGEARAQLREKLGKAGARFREKLGKAGARFREKSGEIRAQLRDSLSSWSRQVEGFASQFRRHFLRARSRYWIIPCITLSIGVPMGALGIVALTRPTTKEVSLQVSCKSIELADEFKLALDERLKAVHLERYEATLEWQGPAPKVSPSGPETAPQGRSGDSGQLVTLRAKEGENPSSFVISPQPDFGEMSVMHIGGGSQVGVPDSSTEFGAALVIDSDQSSDRGRTQLVLQNDEVRLTGHYVLVSNGGLPEQFQQKVSIDASAPSLVTTKCKPIPEAPSTRKPIPRAPSAVEFPPQAILDFGDAPIVVRLAPLEGSKYYKFTLMKCLDSIINVLGEGGLPTRGQAEEIVIEPLESNPIDLTLSGRDQGAGGLALLVQSILRPHAAGASDGPKFIVKWRGRARSVQKDRREMLRSPLAEILDKDATGRGLYGWAIVACLFAAGVLLKRALDILAIQAMPEPKHQRGGG